MSAEILQQAFASTGGVLAHLSPDQLDRPTPCASWTVRELVNHIVGGTTFFAITAETGAAPVRGTGPDYTAGDVVGAFDEGARRAVEAFAPEGAMEKTMKLPFGEFPGSIFVMIAATDAFAHGWDLAKPLGKSTDLDPDLAAQLLSMSMIPDEFRGADGVMPFGPKVEASESACAADKLAAHLGRTP